jgi:RNA polymerase sigma-70 factor (ECF subfamily)
VTSSLFQRVAAGDQDAVKACVDRFGPLVLSMARRFSPSASDAEDAVQEIFLDLWRSAGRFDESRASEVAFVAMVARRRLIDRRRRRLRRPDTEPLPETPLAEAVEDGGVERCVEAKIAQKALDQLRPEQRQVLLLSTLHGLSHEEIADVLGMPLGTVKAHARRGLLRVREMLSGGEPKPALEEERGT